VTEGAYVFMTGRRDSELTAAVKEIGSKATGIQGGDRRIHVNAVSPGSIETPGLSELPAYSQVGEQRLKTLPASNPISRLGTADEVARWSCFWYPTTPVTSWETSSPMSPDTPNITPDGRRVGSRRPEL
jgi:NAD(P)-dependent dehydrogenase (short-subunit alcohol dehydrogenase family)